MVYSSSILKKIQPKRQTMKSNRKLTKEKSCLGTWYKCFHRSTADLNFLCLLTKENNTIPQMCGKK